MTNVIVRVPFILSNASTLEVPRTISVEMGDLHKFVNEVTDLYKYFSGDFEEEELEFLNSHYQSLKEEYDRCNNEIKKQKLKSTMEILENGIIGKTEVKRSALDDCSCHDFDKLKKYGPHNEYRVLWSS